VLKVAVCGPAERFSLDNHEAAELRARPKRRLPRAVFDKSDITIHAMGASPIDD
jgi:hypothetical protein